MGSPKVHYYTIPPQGWPLHAFLIYIIPIKLSLDFILTVQFEYISNNFNQYNSKEVQALHIYHKIHLKFTNSTAGNTGRNIKRRKLSKEPNDYQTLALQRHQSFY